MRDAAAKRACEQIIAAYEGSESITERDALLQSALEEAHAALPYLTDSEAGRSGSSGTLPTVVAWIEGGIVQWMASDHPMQYVVLDSDVEGGNHIEIKMENGNMAEVYPAGTMLASYLPDWVFGLLKELEER
jgi:hypothetical protein